MDPLDAIGSLLLAWHEDERVRTVAALIEPATAGVLADLHLNREAAPQLLRVRLPGMSAPDEQCPALVALRADDWYTRQHLAERALAQAKQPGERHVCGWIASPAEPGALGLGLSAAMRFAPDGGSATMVFRHYDPRVREVLDSTLGAHWALSRVPQASAWCYVARTGLPVVRQQAPHPAPQARPEGASGLSARAQQTLRRCQTINQAIDLAMQTGWSFRPDAPAVCDRALDTATALGYVGEADQLAYLLHTLSLGIGFDRHPLVIQALRQASPGASYAEAIGGLSAEQWRLIGADLPRHPA